MGMRKIYLFLFTALTLSLASAQDLTGLASWYGQPFHGRRTASGEIFNMNELTAAHKTFRFGTRLEVTLLSTGKSVIVRVNDRGPFVENRILDLSQAAAREIGLMSVGIGRIQIRVLGESPVTQTPAIQSPTISQPSNNADIYIQLVALTSQDRAKQYARGVAANNFSPQIRQEGNIFRVFLSLTEVESPGIETRLAENGYSGWQKRRTPIPGTAVAIY